MRTICFDYWSNLRECCGGSVGDRIYIEMTEEEETLFRDAVKKFKEEFVDDLCEFFHENLPANLACRLENAINHSFDCHMLADAGLDYDWVAGLITEDEWEELSFSEQVDLYLKNEPGEDRDWYYTDIEIVK